MKPEVFGKYLLLDKIAAGGMAEIYLAKTTGAENVSKFFAIKRILPQFSQNEDFIAMFKEEAKIAIHLNHANVVPIIEFGEENGIYYLAMQYVEGKNLRQTLNAFKKKSVQLTIPEGVFVIKESAKGLDHAHRCVDGNTGKPLNLVHRDMSPQNLMLSYEGEVLIVDFGIAKAASKLEHTRAGTLKGKFGYMSPEQAEGQEVDFRTDIFSLGICLWELLAHDRLFVSNNEMNTLRKIRDCQIPSLRKIDPNVPIELERITNKALTRDRTLRYQSAEELNRDLHIFLNKHFPEFSHQDLSKTLKKVFQKDRDLNRKRLIEYSKLKAPKQDGKSRYMNDSESFTDVSQKSIKKNLIDKIDVNFKKEEDLVKKSIKQKVRPILKPNQNTGSYSHNVKNVSNSYKYSKDSVPILVMGIFVLSLGLFSYKFYNSTWFSKIEAIYSNFIDGDKSEQANASKPNFKVSNTDLSSKLPNFNIIVTSRPSGAAIYVNGRAKGSYTPAQITIPANKEFNISLKKEGFKNYQESMVITKQGETYEAQLIKKQEAYLNIQVRGGSATVYVDGVRIDNPTLLRSLPILADSNVKIQAINSRTNGYDEEIVDVPPQSTKSVVLQLGKRRYPTGK